MPAPPRAPPPPGRAASAARRSRLWSARRKCRASWPDHHVALIEARQHLDAAVDRQTGLDHDLGAVLQFHVADAVAPVDDVGRDDQRVALAGGDIDPSSFADEEITQ